LFVFAILIAFYVHYKLYEGVLGRRSKTIKSLEMVCAEFKCQTDIIKVSEILQIFENKGLLMATCLFHPNPLFLPGETFFYFTGAITPLFHYSNWGETPKFLLVTIRKKSYKLLAPIFLNESLTSNISNIMGLLSSRISITRYKVSGQLDGSVHETVYHGLKQHAISKIEDDGSEALVGWTSFEHPYAPDFEGYSFVFGTHMVFALRIDKKSISPKLVRKHYALEVAKHLEETDRNFLSGNEKKTIKEHVIKTLGRRIPAIPNVYDLAWDYQKSSLWFFSNLKSANEVLETLFIKSFGLALIRLFPYTTADLVAGLSDGERDLLLKLAPRPSEE
jgi:recombination associated protein RdgC